MGFWKEGNYSVIYLIMYWASRLAGPTPAVLNLLFNVIYTNKMFTLSFCRGIPSIVKLRNHQILGWYMLYNYGAFPPPPVLVLKHIKQTWLGGTKSDRKGKQGAFQRWRSQMKALLLLYECLLSGIFKFVVHLLRCFCILSPGVFQRSTKLPLVDSKRIPSGRFNVED